MQFLHWVMALGDGVKITSPQSVVEKLEQEIRRLSGQYGIK
ncbi:MAG: WYL domain-containing protein [Clostridiaceae bacterium]|nr:WYL domain-containing protein [Clostridiaceae bacterium]